MRVALACVALGIVAAAPETAVPVGERAPDFTLSDAAGRSHSLESLLGHGSLVLLFFRSADW
ncbi:MAG: hypothetical protein ACE5IL_08115 [Myxococcota bacterium]